MVSHPPTVCGVSDGRRRGGGRGPRTPRRRGGRCRCAGWRCHGRCSTRTAGGPGGGRCGCRGPHRCGCGPWRTSARPLGSGGAMAAERMIERRPLGAGPHHRADRSRSRSAPAAGHPRSSRTRRRARRPGPLQRWLQPLRPRHRADPHRAGSGSDDSHRGHTAGTIPLGPEQTRSSRSTSSPASPLPTSSPTWTHSPDRIEERTSSAAVELRTRPLLHRMAVIAVSRMPIPVSRVTKGWDTWDQDGKPCRPVLVGRGPPCREAVTRIVWAVQPPCSHPSRGGRRRCPGCWTSMGAVS